MTQIIKNNQNVSFLYAGGESKDMIKKYQDYVRSESLDNKILFIGKQKDVLPILKGSDIFILTSIQEGMPNVLIEAMASKIPTVCTDVDGVSEIIIDGENGLIVDANDVASMVKKITSLLKENKKYEFISTNAFRTANEKFNMEAMIDSYENLIRDNLAN